MVASPTKVIVFRNQIDNGVHADNLVSKLVGGEAARDWVEIMGRLASADWSVTTESGVTRYLEEVRRVPMLEPHEEYTLAKRWREHGDHGAAHQLVNSHLRLVARIARGHRGYGLPISELISEGNVGLMQAIKRFEPDKGFRFAPSATWWIKAAIQEYILRSWSLVKMGTKIGRAHV